MKQLILFPKRLILLIDMRSGNLKCHILIRDLRNIRDEKDKCQTEDEDANGEVNPLNALERRDIVGRFCEESVRTKDRTNDCADGIEGLGEVNSDFGIAGWTADYFFL